MERLHQPQFFCVSLRGGYLKEISFMVDVSKNKSYIEAKRKLIKTDMRNEFCIQLKQTAAPGQCTPKTSISN